MFIPSTFKRPVSSWKALNLRKTLLMASSVRLKPLNCSRLPCVYAQETLTFLLTQKKTCVKRSEERRVGKECRSRWAPAQQKKTAPKLCPPDRQAPQTHASTRTQQTAPPPEALRAAAAPGEQVDALAPLWVSFFFQAEDGIRDRSRHSC